MIINIKYLESLTNVYWFWFSIDHIHTSEYSIQNIYYKLIDSDDW